MSSMRQQPVRIGTRGSPLALAQASEARARLLAAHPWLPGDQVSIRPIRTTGDQEQNRKLSEIGGKGLFTREIEDALLAGEIDLAVHSMKDMPTLQPDGLAIVCLLPREDPRDMLISRAAASIADLPIGAVMGTSSLRRQALLLRARPDLKIVMLRGNVETRLAKLDMGAVDATVLAVAGLRRLGLQPGGANILAVDTMLPAVAQGAIGIEARCDDAEIIRLLQPLNHPPTEFTVRAERAFLAALDGSCRTPIAALAEIGEDGGLALRGQIVRPDGSLLFETLRTGAVADAGRMGTDAGEELRRLAGAGFFTPGS